MQYTHEQIITSNNCVVRSRAEAMIDDSLHKLQINHVCEKKIIIQGRVVKPDFYLRKTDTIIEYWGLEDKAWYRANQRKKLQLYKAHNIACLSIRPKDIENVPKLEKTIKNSLQNI